MSAAPQLAAGVALATLAAGCFDGAVALQAVEARALPVAVRPTRLALLVRRPRWLAATALAIVGWPLQLGALALAPLTVVQPTLALGLVVLLALGARLLGEPVGVRGLAGTAGIAAGVGALAWSAPEPSHVQGSAIAIAGWLIALGAIAGAPWLPRRSPRGDVFAFAAGCAFAGSALTSKLLVDALAAGDLVSAVGWAAATVALAGVGLGDEMAALQRVAATRVAGAAFAVQVIVPVLAAPTVAGERWGRTPLAGAVILFGVAAVVAGALTLQATPGVRRLESAGRSG
jgi:drug/metabolite transporter (DMT)-like permease